MGVRNSAGDTTARINSFLKRRSGTEATVHCGKPVAAVPPGIAP
jgi:hypothetical protein